jgi:hypothetical protein
MVDLLKGWRLRVGGMRLLAFRSMGCCALENGSSEFAFAAAVRVRFLK